jgi:small-conductance mechanosensitive channel
MIDSKLINAILIVLAFWAGSYLITLFFKGLEKATKKTGSDLDDKIIQAAQLPIRYTAILLGFYFAVNYYGVTGEFKGVTLADVFLVLIILLAGFTASRLLKAFLGWYTEHDKIRKTNQTMFIFIRKVVSAFVYIIALLIILQQLGIQIGPLLAGLGVAGLAVALGLQEPLSNLFSALFLAMDKSINVGDWIQLEDGTKAFIEDINWRSVTIRTREGNTVIVPNAVFVGQKIASYDYPESPFFTFVSVGVAYGSDLEKVEKAAIGVANKIIESEKLPTDDSPRIRFRALTDSSINFDLRLKIDKARKEGLVKHKLIKGIISEFRKENIEIPYPQRVIHQAKE